MSKRHLQNCQYALPFDLPCAERVPATSIGIGKSTNSIHPKDRAIHDWYRFVLSYPPHLVRNYIQDFRLDENAVLLDPFCGTGTTLVEAKFNNIRSIGVEANPFPHFASQVKTNWNVSPDALTAFARRISEKTYMELADQGIDDWSLTAAASIDLKTLDSRAMSALIKNSISPLPLHKVLVLLEQIDLFKNTPVHSYGILALGNAIVTSIGNLRFGPEVGIGKIKKDVRVVALWMEEIMRMIHDLKLIQGKTHADATIFLADARTPVQEIEKNSIDAVITSPPYPNEKDYTRTTRLESVILGFIKDMVDLRIHKKRLLRSNTRGVYKSDADDQWIKDIDEIQNLASVIESRRIELGKTSGFEKLYAKVTKLYFGGMARHLSELTPFLKPGAKLAYVVGDQASYFRVMIKTGRILADIAERQGYRVERIDLFRTRFATVTQNELREEVVVLRWPGSSRT